jgi:hypothetical protein
MRREFSNRQRKKYLHRRSLTSAAEAGFENKPVIAAVNRCATQKSSAKSSAPFEDTLCISYSLQNGDNCRLGAAGVTGRML